MKRYNFILIALASLFFSVQSMAQYSISVEIKDNKDSVMYLGNYYLKGTYALDTAYNKKGKFVFLRKKKDS